VKNIFLDYVCNNVCKFRKKIVLTPNFFTLNLMRFETIFTLLLKKDDKVLYLYLKKVIFVRR